MQDQLNTFSLFSRLTSFFTSAADFPSLLSSIKQALDYCQIKNSFELFIWQEEKLFLGTQKGLIEKNKEQLISNSLFWKDLIEDKKTVQKGNIMFIPVVSNRSTAGFLTTEVFRNSEEEELFKIIANLVGLCLPNIVLIRSNSPESRDLYNLLNIFPIIITIKDREGKFLFVNTFAKNTLQLCHDIVGKTYADIFPKETATELRKIDEQVWKEGKTKTSTYSVDQDENKKHYLTGKAKISLAGQDLLATFSLDISKEVVALDSLALTELKYKQLVETATDFIYRCNSDGKFIYMNQVGLNILGKSLEEVQQMHYLDFVRPDYQDKVLQYTKEQFSARTASCYYEAPIITVKGEVWLGANVSMEMDNDWIQGYNVLARDITERKKVEEELLSAKKAAEGLMKSKEQFISVMSHEIRTPMNAVVGMANLLADANCLPHQKQYLDVLKISADNLLNILNNVLDLSKIEAGKLRQESFRFSLRETLNKTKQTFKHIAEEKKIDFSIDVADNVPDILWGDQLKLNQIFLNLVSNAIKFTSKGFVKVTVKVKKRYLSEIVLTFNVEDSGIGINENQINSIFESFTQASSDISSQYGGTGLGLTITKKLVEFLGGEIFVKSIPKTGSTFNFTLSFKYKALEQILDIEPEDQTSDNDLSGLRVLVAEDNEMNQLLINEFLTNKGMHVDIAKNGKESVERVEVRSYDIILMDLQMPVMNGYEAAKIIKAYHKVPIIALTASTSLTTESHDFDELVTKPFEPKELFSKIATLTGREFLIKRKKNEQGMSSLVTNLNYLKEASAGNVKFIHEMINIFLRQTPGYLSLLKELGDQKDWLEFRKIMHKIKPTISMMGIYSLDSVVKQIEICSKEHKNLEQLPILLAELENVCGKAFIELKEELTRN